MDGDDDIEDFLNFSPSSNFKRETVISGVCGGRVIPNTEHEPRSTKREHFGTEYAEEYTKEEQHLLFQTFVDNGMEVNVGASTSKFDELDGLSDLMDNDDKPIKFDINAMQAIYREFEFDRPCMKLPILFSREEIMIGIDENPVVIIQGDTGCGKTTQVPQYILDDAYRKQQHCNIIVTQPRKIAASSNAKRVAMERRCNIGSLVGYQVGLKAETSEQTRLLYCTTGVLLQKLIKTKNMCRYTHVILDEVHERDEDMDFLFIVVRRLLAINSPRTKIILMSATIDAFQFANYFKIPISRQLAPLPAPIIKVDQKRQYDVHIFYYDDLTRIWPSQHGGIDYSTPGIEDDVYLVALRLVSVSERFEEDEMKIKNQPLTTKYTILMFLPGLYEIERMYKMLEQHFQNENTKQANMLLPLHSTITKEEQERVFREAQPGVRKIILATNIAESSITVPNVRYVIDFCLTKSIYTDRSTNYTYLRMDWASKNNCKQRSGRAGRVMSGRVYRLVSRRYYEQTMEEENLPEILRCPLENVVLKAKMLEMGPPQGILALAMSPPDLSDINNAILVLKEVGALLRTCYGKYVTSDGDITFIGRIMAALPIDIRISRMLVFGYVFSMLEQCIIIAAGLTVRSIFRNPFADSLKAYMKKLAWADGSSSDCFAILRAYMTWMSYKIEHVGRDEKTQKLWGQRNFIEVKAMKEMEYLVAELTIRLENLGIKDAMGPMRVIWTSKEEATIMKIIITGAFYPNYFYQASTNMNDERQAYAELGGRDPCNTVYFKGFETKYFAPLYQKNVKKLLEPAVPKSEHIKVAADAHCQKIYVTFNNYESTVDKGVSSNDYKTSFVPGRVVPEVYRVLKLGKLSDFNPILQVLPPHEAIEYAEGLGHGVFDVGKWVSKKKLLKTDQSIVPSIHTLNVIGLVTHVEHCDKFWFQPINDVNEESLTMIQSALNTKVLKQFKALDDISVDQLVAAPYADDPKDEELYFRARILEIGGNDSTVTILIQFIDYGNYDCISLEKIRSLVNLPNGIAEIPPRAFQCQLCECQPSKIDATRGRWTEQAVKKFNALTKNRTLTANVYSTVNGVASVTLFNDTQNLNDKLIQAGFATSAEENYLSKMNHDLRVRTQRQYCGNVFVNNQTDTMDEIDEMEMPVVDPPPFKKCRIKVKLVGPCSPLETKLLAATNLSSLTSVNVESESVNSILLNTDMQSTHCRLIVAASVSKQNQRKGLIIRQTTVCPNIHGFGVLMALIFCPTMEIRRDSTKSRYISVMTGLGYHPQTKQALFPEHDIVFDLDFDLKNEDLERTNQIRYLMNSLMYDDKEGMLHPPTEYQRNQIRAKIKELIIQLLEIDRNSIEVQYTTNRDKWGLNEIDPDLMKLSSPYEFSTIFPQHCGLEHYEQPSTSVHNVDLRRHCAELHSLARLSFSQQKQPETRCRLCDMVFDSVTNVRLHLFSKLHRAREAQIQYTDLKK